MSDLDELFKRPKGPLCKICNDERALSMLRSIADRMLAEKVKLPSARIARFMEQKLHTRLRAENVLDHLRNHEPERWAQIEAL